MDCEKYDPLLDELYEELDELTSAAVKRHVSGCARCASTLDRMRATRRLAALPLVAVPAGLEERVLAAAREAQKVVPLRSRVSRFVAWAGTWAMRPQTAMAAVFLLMVGTIPFVLRRSHHDAATAVSVTVAGQPAPPSPAPTSERESLDTRTAAAAHGATAPAAAAPAAPAASVVATGPLDGLTNGTGRGEAKDDEGALASALAQGANAGTKADKSADKGASDLSARAAAAPALPSVGATGAGFGSGAAEAPAKKRADDDGQSGYAAGMAAYRARNFAEATRNFDAAAANGDVRSALWAAKSVRSGSGCAAALGRFEQVAQRASGSNESNEASLEAARCQIELGQLEAARQRLNVLTGVPSYAAQATQALAELNQVAARRAAESGAGKAGSAGTPGRAAPARPAAAKPAATQAPAADGY